MLHRISNRVAALFAVALILGCSDTSSNTPSSSSDSGSAPFAAKAAEGIVKVAVMADGTVYVNSKAVPVGSLGSELDEIGEIKEIWYHRESPESAEPHENAMKVIAEIANRKLPIAMYLDREFTQRAKLPTVGIPRIMD